MTRRRAHSPQTVEVMRALVTDPLVWRHGYDLVVDLGLKSGSLYPILIRLADRGLLDSRWEPTDVGRPPRHVYRLTAAGLAEAAAATRVATSPVRRTQLGTA